MESIICKICNSESDLAFTSKLLNKYDVKYYKCKHCEYLFTEDPFWLNEAYERSINLSDTGLLMRNLYFSEILSVVIYFYFNKDAAFLDYAGGYGVFTRLMRDIGFDFYWHDPYTQNLFANGFEKDINDSTKYELITAFEVFEHFINPKDEIAKMVKLSDTIVFSTELMLQQIPDPKSWWYYAFDHGQHISFYSKKTMNYLAKQFEMNYYDVNGIQIFTRKKLNNTKLIIMKKLRNYGLLWYIKKQIAGKTFTDHLIIKKSK